MSLRKTLDVDRLIVTDILPRGSNNTLISTGFILVSDGSGGTVWSPYATDETLFSTVLTIGTALSNTQTTTRQSTLQLSSFIGTGYSNLKSDVVTTHNSFRENVEIFRNAVSTIASNVDSISSFRAYQLYTNSTFAILDKKLQNFQSSYALLSVVADGDSRRRSTLNNLSSATVFQFALQSTTAFTRLNDFSTSQTAILFNQFSTLSSFNVNTQIRFSTLLSTLDTVLISTVRVNDTLLSTARVEYLSIANSLLSTSLTGLRGIIASNATTAVNLSTLVFSVVTQSFPVFNSTANGTVASSMSGLSRLLFSEISTVGNFAQSNASTAAAIAIQQNQRIESTEILNLNNFSTLRSELSIAITQGINLELFNQFGNLRVKQSSILVNNNSSINVISTFIGRNISTVVSTFLSAASGNYRLLEIVQQSVTTVALNEFTSTTSSFILSTVLGLSTFTNLHVLRLSTLMHSTAVQFSTFGASNILNLSSFASTSISTVNATVLSTTNAVSTLNASNVSTVSSLIRNANSNFSTFADFNIQKVSTFISTNASTISAFSFSTVTGLSTIGAADISTVSSILRIARRDLSTFTASSLIFLSSAFSTALSTQLSVNISTVNSISTFSASAFSSLSSILFIGLSNVSSQTTSSYIGFSSLASTMNFSAVSAGMSTLEIMSILVASNFSTISSLMLDSRINLSTFAVSTLASLSTNFSTQSSTFNASVLSTTRQLSTATQSNFETISTFMLSGRIFISSAAVSSLMSLSTLASSFAFNLLSAQTSTFNATSTLGSFFISTMSTFSRDALSTFSTIYSTQFALFSTTTSSLFGMINGNTVNRFVGISSFVAGILFTTLSNVGENTLNTNFTSFNNNATNTSNSLNLIVNRASTQLGTLTSTSHIRVSSFASTSIAAINNIFTTQINEYSTTTGSLLSSASTFYMVGSSNLSTIGGSNVSTLSSMAIALISTLSTIAVSTTHGFSTMNFANMSSLSSLVLRGVSNISTQFDTIFTSFSTLVSTSIVYAVSTQLSATIGMSTLNAVNFSSLSSLVTVAMSSLSSLTGLSFQNISSVTFSNFNRFATQIEISTNFVSSLSGSNISTLSSVIRANVNRFFEITSTSVSTLSSLITIFNRFNATSIESSVIGVSTSITNNLSNLSTTWIGSASNISSLGAQNFSKLSSLFSSLIFSLSTNANSTAAALANMGGDGQSTLSSIIGRNIRVVSNVGVQYVSSLSNVVSSYVSSFAYKASTLIAENSTTRGLQFQTLSTLLIGAQVQLSTVGLSSLVTISSFASTFYNFTISTNISTVNILSTFFNSNLSTFSTLLRRNLSSLTGLGVSTFAGFSTLNIITTSSLGASMSSASINFSTSSGRAISNLCNAIEDSKVNLSTANVIFASQISSIVFTTFSTIQRTLLRSTAIVNESFLSTISVMSSLINFTRSSLSDIASTLVVSLSTLVKTNLLNAKIASESTTDGLLVLQDESLNVLGELYSTAYMAVSTIAFSSLVFLSSHTSTSIIRANSNIAMSTIFLSSLSASNITSISTIVFRGLLRLSNVTADMFSNISVANFSTVSSFTFTYSTVLHDLSTFVNSNASTVSTLIFFGLQQLSNFNVSSIESLSTQSFVLATNLSTNIGRTGITTQQSSFITLFTLSSLITNSILSLSTIELNTVRQFSTILSTTMSTNLGNVLDSVLSVSTLATRSLQNVSTLILNSIGLLSNFATSSIRSLSSITSTALVQQNQVNISSIVGQSTLVGTTLTIFAGFVSSSYSTLYLNITSTFFSTSLLLTSSNEQFRSSIFGIFSTFSTSIFSTFEFQFSTLSSLNLQTFNNLKAAITNVDTTLNVRINNATASLNTFNTTNIPVVINSFRELSTSIFLGYSSLSSAYDNTVKVNSDNIIFKNMVRFQQTVDMQGGLKTTFVKNEFTVMSTTTFFANGVSNREYKIPTDADRLFIQAWGAGGARGFNTNGGGGAYVEGFMDLQPNADKLFITVGEGGTYLLGNVLTNPTNAVGGGGKGIKGRSGGGGGASLICNKINEIIAVGGGGGGGGFISSFAWQLGSRQVVSTFAQFMLLRQINGQSQVVAQYANGISTHFTSTVPSSIRFTVSTLNLGSVQFRLPVNYNSTIFDSRGETSNTETYFITHTVLFDITRKITQNVQVPSTYFTITSNASTFAQTRFTSASAFVNQEFYESTLIFNSTVPVSFTNSVLLSSPFLLMGSYGGPGGVDRGMSGRSPFFSTNENAEFGLGGIPGAATGGGGSPTGVLLLSTFGRAIFSTISTLNFTQGLFVSTIWSHFSSMGNAANPEFVISVQTTTLRYGVYAARLTTEIVQNFQLNQLNIWLYAFGNPLDGPVQTQNLSTTTANVSLNIPTPREPLQLKVTGIENTDTVNIYMSTVWSTLISTLYMSRAGNVASPQNPTIPMYTGTGTSSLGFWGGVNTNGTSDAITPSQFQFITSMYRGGAAYVDNSSIKGTNITYHTGANNITVVSNDFSSVTVLVPTGPLFSSFRIGPLAGNPDSGHILFGISTGLYPLLISTNAAGASNALVAAASRLESTARDYLRLSRSLTFTFSVDLLTQFNTSNVLLYRRSTPVVTLFTGASNLITIAPGGPTLLNTQITRPQAPDPSNDFAGGGGGGGYFPGGVGSGMYFFDRLGAANATSAPIVTALGAGGGGGGASFLGTLGNAGRSAAGSNVSSGLSYHPVVNQCNIGTGGVNFNTRYNFYNPGGYFIFENDVRNTNGGNGMVIITAIRSPVKVQTSTQHGIVNAFLVDPVANEVIVNKIIPSSVKGYNMFGLTSTATIDFGNFQNFNIQISTLLNVPRSVVIFTNPGNINDTRLNYQQGKIAIQILGTNNANAQIQFNGYKTPPGFTSPVTRTNGTHVYNYLIYNCNVFLDDGNFYRDIV